MTNTYTNAQIDIELNYNKISIPIYVHLYDNIKIKCNFYKSLLTELFR